MSAAQPNGRFSSPAAWARHLPNLITVARFVLVAPAGWLLWHGAVVEALALIAIAGISDAVDGELARRFDSRTRFGTIADPAADKLLVLVVFVVLAIQEHVPIWLVAMIVGREVVILCGALAYRSVFGNFRVVPSSLSKVNTGVQIVVLVLVLISLTDFTSLASFAAAVIDPAGFVVAGVSSVLSGIDYVIVWSRRARDGFRMRRGEHRP